MNEEEGVFREEEANEEAPKVSKITKKRQQILNDRIKRHMASGKTYGQALDAVRQENYERLPIDKKLEHLEHIMSKALRALSEDIVKLRENEEMLADTIDRIFRSVELMFIKLGLGEEDREACMAQSDLEFNSMKDVPELKTEESKAEEPKIEEPKVEVQ